MGTHSYLNACPMSLTSTCTLSIDADEGTHPNNGFEILAPNLAPDFFTDTKGLPSTSIEKVPLLKRRYGVALS